jgi:thiosulfate/3-mercaptopyruvate sulfurtransferase
MGLFSAARVWWNFRLMGKTDVAVLDGGFPKWQAEGRAVEDLPPMLRDRHITVQRQAAPGAGRDAGCGGLQARGLADRRRPVSPRGSRARRPRPRPGLRSGHIPGSKNVHYATLLNADGTMKGLDALKRCSRRQASTMKRTITTCGSGVTAAIVMLALTRLGNSHVSLYDGSWSEWGQFDQLPVATG